MFKRLSIYFIFFFTYLFPALGCTSAIIGADMNPYGRPLLWKNRDTSNVNNKVEYIPGNEDDFAYVALFNANDRNLEEAWIGMNEYGFAVMNTASYNIKDDDIPEKEMDKEGRVMSIALTKCKTVEDFANMLDTLPKPLGVEANFGAIDAYGHGAYFETNNYSYNRFNIEDTPQHVLVRTNYSHSGRKNDGYGFVREANANYLLAPFIEQKNISPEVLTETLSRSFYHDLLKEDFSKTENRWVIDQDFIPRFSSTATVVVEGCKPLREGERLSPDYMKSQYIMWTGLGYPPCSEIFPVKCETDGVDDSLKGKGNLGHSEQCDKVLKRKDEVFPLKKGNGNKYIDMDKLFNRDGKGYVQLLVPQNLDTYRVARFERDNR